MKRGSFEICHCLNAFPGTDLRSKADVFEKRLPLVRKLIPDAENAPFAGGIWFDASTVSSLVKSRKVRDFASFVRGLGFYAFTANAFPYGVFHGARVKRSVYTPDWSSDDRRDYTIAVADILSEFMPPESEGSVSSLPGAYGRFPVDEGVAARNILSVAEHLLRLYERTGRRIILGVEPEPDCQWGRIRDFISFYQRYIAGSPFAPFAGVCYDTCHQELDELPSGEGLRLLRSEGIPVAKIQLSSAVSAFSAEGKRHLVSDFQDSVYLHQTREFSADGRIVRSFEDLPYEASGEGEWRTHFHIPVFADGISAGLRAAKNELESVLSILEKEPSVCRQLEIETYSYGVLPEFLKSASMEASMAREMN